MSLDVSDTAKNWFECSRAERIERSENVMRVISGLSQKQIKDGFRMAHWANYTLCGTTACAAGTCAFDPYFISQGFEAVLHELKSENESFFSYGFKGMQPEDFFGEWWTDAVFVRDALLNDDDPVSNHAAVLVAIQDHIDFVKGGEVDVAYINRMGLDPRDNIADGDDEFYDANDGDDGDGE